jgi:hypothetical protein
MMNGTEIYLVIHGITTVGALVGFLIKNESRLTRLETTLKLFHDEHMRITGQVYGKDIRHHV